VNGIRAEVFYCYGQGWQVRLFPVGEPAGQFGLDWPVQPEAGNPAREEAERELSRRGWTVGPDGWSGDILSGRSWAEVIPAQHHDRTEPGSDADSVTCQPAQPGHVALVLPLARIITSKPRGTGHLILRASDAHALAAQLRRAARRARDEEQ
jgi:hypothetical protein